MTRTRRRIGHIPPTRRAHGAGRSRPPAIGTGAVVVGLAGLVALAGVSACGIRGTELPVDGGPAPTRATCDAPAVPSSGEPTRDRDDGTEIYLVCGSQVQPVERKLRMTIPTDTGVLAETLLDQLQQGPGREERTAGFLTEVPSTLAVSVASPATADSLPVLRLSQGPGDLPAPALRQLICTFANADGIGNGDSVVLSGPPGSSSERPKSYLCSIAARTAPTATHGHGVG
ncbi:hypothetical protein ACTWP5_18720 [Streptomyces sp. 4N509B]|uniref:hypothetical protein n=1 Tax=Streptomyces sp. 4N509B TaxID=3457413 RepID=UPI003FD1260D